MPFIRTPVASSMPVQNLSSDTTEKVNSWGCFGSPFFGRHPFEPLPSPSAFAVIPSRKRRRSRLANRGDPIALPPHRTRPGPGSRSNSSTRGPSSGSAAARCRAAGPARRATAASAARSGSTASPNCTGSRRYCDHSLSDLTDRPPPSRSQNRYRLLRKVERPGTKGISRTVSLVSGEGG